MKTGRTINDLAVEVQRQQRTKLDMKFVPSFITWSVLGGDEVALTIPQKVRDMDTFKVNPWAHSQVSEYAGIPAKYYDRMLAEAPELLVNNLNTWFSRRDKAEDRRFIRTLDGSVRAFMSDRYRRLDNYDLMEQAVLPVVFGKDNPLGTILEVESCEITEKKLYLKVSTPKLTMNIKVGDVVQSGFIISNSEIGAGAVSVKPFIKRLACLNGMVVDDLGQRKYHIGRAGNGGDGDADELYSDETLRADDKAFWLKVRDLLKACLNETVLRKVVTRLQEAEKIPVTGRPDVFMGEIANRMGLNEGESAGILTRFLSDGEGHNKFGLVQAITAYSAQVEDYGRATELETLGGKVLSLAPSEWQAISEKAAA